MEYGCEEVCKAVCVYNVCVCVHNVYYSVSMARLLSGTRLCVYHTYYSTITILHMQQQTPNEPQVTQELDQTIPGSHLTL